MSYKRISPVPVVEGGTGDQSFTAYSVITGGATSNGALQNVVGVGTSAQVLTSNGPGALPTWQTGSGGTTPATSCSFSVYLAAGTISVTGDGTVYTLTYDTKRFDVGTNFTLPSTFTAPATGTYFFVSNIYTNTGSVPSLPNSYLINAVVSGSSAATYAFGISLTFFTATPGTGGGLSHNNGLYVQMTSGDTMTFNVEYSGGTKNTQVSSGTFLMGYRVT